MNRLRLSLCALLIALALWIDPIWAPLCPVALFMPVFATCTIFADDFSADGIGSTWTVDSGTWAVSGGELVCSAGGFIVANTAGTSGHGRTIVRGKASTTNSFIKLVGAYVDANNYIYAQVWINGASSSLDLYQVSGGSGSTIASYPGSAFTTSTGTYYTLELCWDGAVAKALCSAATRSVSGTCSASGNKAGVGVSLSTGTATFDDFQFLKHHVDDSQCNACGSGSDDEHDNGVDETEYDGTGDCGSNETCLDGIAPRYLKVVVAGTTGGICTGCDAWLGTYVIQLQTPIPSTAGQCGLWTVCDAGVGRCSDDDTDTHCLYEWSGGAYGYLGNCPSPCGTGPGTNVPWYVRFKIVKLANGNFLAVGKIGGQSGICQGLTEFVGSESPVAPDCTAFEGLVLSYYCRGNNTTAAELVNNKCYLTAGTMTVSVF